MIPLKEIEKLVTRMDVKLSAKMRQRILDGILKVPKKSVKTPTTPPLARGKIVSIKKKILIILFPAAARAVATRAVAALIVSVSAGTIIYKTVIANPQSLPAQELTIPCESSSSDEIGLQVDNKVQVEDRAAGYPVTVKLFLGDDTGYGFSALDNTQFDIFSGSIVTDICTFDNSRFYFFDGLIDSELMAWGSSKVTLSCDLIGGDLDILSSSILTTDGSLLDYNFGEISDAKSVLTGIFANGDKINNRFYLHDDVSTVAIPAPSAIVLAAIGLGTIASIRRRLH